MEKIQAFPMKNIYDSYLSMYLRDRKNIQLKNIVLRNFKEEESFYLYLYQLQDVSLISDFYLYLPKKLRKDKNFFLSLYSYDGYLMEQKRKNPEVLWNLSANYLVKYMDPSLLQDPEFLQNVIDLDPTGCFLKYPPYKSYHEEVATKIPNISKSLIKHFHFMKDPKATEKQMDMSKETFDVNVLKQTVQYLKIHAQEEKDLIHVLEEMEKTYQKKKSK